MKELTIEQKAKAYDKALEKSKRLYEQGTITESLCYVFPELKESEDEQSKKWILEYLYDGLRKSDEQFKGQFKAAIAWLEKQAQSTTITIPKDLKGTDTDGGVVGERGEQGEQPTEEEMIGMGELGKVWSEQAIISKLDKIIELLQSVILAIPRGTYVPTTIYKNPLDQDPNTLGGWETTASTEVGEE